MSYKLLPPGTESHGGVFVSADEMADAKAAALSDQPTNIEQIALFHLAGPAECDIGVYCR